MVRRVKKDLDHDDGKESVCLVAKERVVINHEYVEINMSVRGLPALNSKP